MRCNIELDFRNIKIIQGIEKLLFYFCRPIEQSFNRNAKEFSNSRVPAQSGDNTEVPRKRIQGRFFEGTYPRPPGKGTRCGHQQRFHSGIRCAGRQKENSGRAQEPGCEGGHGLARFR